MQRVDANGRLFIRVDVEPWALFAMKLQSGTRDIGVRFDSKTNGTGALRQFVSKATRLSSRVAFCYLRLVPACLVQGTAE
jgi:hypothetical protein